MIRTITSFLILGFLISGCSILPKAKPVEVRTIAEIPPMYHPPLPLEMQLVDVKFEILTPELMEEYLKLVEEGNAPRKAYYSLTSKEYENLSMNMAEVKRYIRDTLSIVAYYREYDKKEDTEDSSKK